MVSIEVWTNWPATAMIGPLPHGSVTARLLLRAASAAAIGRPCGSSAVTSASPGGLSWSKPSAVRSMISSQSRMDTFTVSVTFGRSSSVCAPASAASRRTCGPSPRSTATSRGCAGSVDELGATRSAPTSVGCRQFQGQVRRCAVLHHALRRRPRRARIAVGSRVGGAEHVDRVRVAGGRRGAWRSDQVGEVGALSRPHPDRRGHRDRLRHRQRPAQVHRLLGRQRHRRRAVHAVGPLGAARAAEQLGAEIPLCDNGVRRRTGNLDGVAQLDRVGEARRVVLGDAEVGDAELHAGRPVVGADGGDADPRGLAVGQRRGDRLARLVEAQRACPVDGGDLDAADLCADGRRTRRDGDGGVGDRVVEVDLQPLPDGGLQRIGHPARRRVAVDGRRGCGRGRDVGQRGGVRRRTRHRDTTAGPGSVHGPGVA